MALRRPRRRLLTLGLAVGVMGCGGQVQPTVPVSISATASASLPNVAFPSVSAPHAPGLIGHDWAKATLVEQPEGDPNATTPPYNNPGSLGHPQHYQGGQADLLDVIAGPTQIAVGYVARDFRAAAWSSTDGLTWRLVDTFPSEEFSVATAVARGETGVVAVGGAGVDAGAWFSTDGRSWKRIVVDAFHDETQIRMTSVTAWKGGFVAGGYVGSLSGPIRAAFWASPDGQDWRREHDEPGFADSRVAGIVAAVHGSRLVAVGATGDAKSATGAAAWVSTDGAQWQRADGTDLDGTVMNAVSSGPDGLVAVGSDVRSVRAIAWKSADGRRWTEARDAAPLDNFGLKIEMRDVTWTGSGYLAGGHLLFGTQFPSGLLWTSEDGTQWTRAADVPALSQGKVQGVTAGGPGLIAVGSFGSPDVAIPTIWVSPPP